MKLSDFGLCKPLDCSNFPNLSELDYTSVANSKLFLDGDKTLNSISVAHRTQQEQLLHWQKNRRMLVNETFLLTFGILGQEYLARFLLRIHQ